MKKRKSIVINNDEYVELDDISTFDLENHNHIFKSQKPKNSTLSKYNSNQSKIKYKPPKVTKVKEELDFSYQSTSSDEDQFESAIEF